FLVLARLGATFRGHLGVCFGGCGLVPAVGGCVSGLLGRVLAAAALAAATTAPAPAGGTARRGVLILLASAGGPILRWLLRVRATVAGSGLASWRGGNVRRLEDHQRWLERGSRCCLGGLWGLWNRGHLRRLPDGGGRRRGISRRAVRAGRPGLSRACLPGLRAGWLAGPAGCAGCASALAGLIASRLSGAAGLVASRPSGAARLITGSLGRAAGL